MTTPRADRAAGLRYPNAEMRFLSALLLIAFLWPPVSASPHTPPAALQQADLGASDGMRWLDVAAPAGLHFLHHSGAEGDKHLPEMMGGGVAWLDFDVDGAADIYFVDSGPLPGSTPSSNTDLERSAGSNLMLRGNQRGTFSAVADAASDIGYGMGVAVGDYDADGWADLLVTNLGPDVLYRNNGDGTFSDVTASANVGGEGWSTGASWGDLDRDGHLDLYIASYLLYDFESVPFCGLLAKGLRYYCHPRMFDGTVDSLYRNRQDGTFENVTGSSGVGTAGGGNGLGVVMADLTDNGQTDIYVANDSTPNFLFVNLGGFRFEERGFLSGIALGQAGEPQAGMGIDFSDLDGDGTIELLVTNFAAEPNNLYKSFKPGLFLDESYMLGLGQATYARLGFGISVVDLDGDTDLDLVLVNGHIQDHVPRFKQPNQLFENRLADERRSLGEVARGAPSGRSTTGANSRATAHDRRTGSDLLRDVSLAAGEAFGQAEVSRGLAYGDFDSDGWPDLVLTNIDAEAELLRNTAPNQHRRLVLRLSGRSSNRDAFGASVWVTPLLTGADDTLVPGIPQRHEIRSSSSYLSQSSTDVYAGLGAAHAAAVEIRWPDGTTESIPRVEAGQLALLVEGRGLVASRRLRERDLSLASLGDNLSGP